MNRKIYTYITYISSAILVYTILEVPTNLKIQTIVLLIFLGVIYIMLSRRPYSETSFMLKSQIYSTILDHIICFVLFIIGIVFIDSNMNGVGVMAMQISMLYYLIKNTAFPSFGSKAFKAYYQEDDKVRFIENLFLILPLYLFVIIQRPSMDRYHDALYMISNFILVFNFIDLAFFLLKKSRMRILRYIIFYTQKNA